MILINYILLHLTQNKNILIENAYILVLIL